MCYLADAMCLNDTSLWIYNWSNWMPCEQKPTNSLSQQIRILHKTNKKNVLVNCWPSGKDVHLLYMYSILGRGSFCFNYCLNSAWHGGDQFVALLRWYGSPGFFDSGLQLICIFWSLVSHFLLTIPHRFSMGFRSGKFAGQSSTPTPWSFNQLWCFWQCGQVPNPAG